MAGRSLSSGGPSARPGARHDVPPAARTHWSVWVRRPAKAQRGAVIRAAKRTAEQRLRRVLAPIAHLHIGQFRVLRAVWLTRFRCIIAEPEATGPRFADRPAAGDDTPV